MSGGLFNYCFRLLGDWHYAEDILVDTFTKLAHSDLDEHGNIKAWLYRVATNDCYSHFRKKRTESKCIQEQLQRILSNPGHDIAEELRIQKIISTLPEYQRVMVVLKFYERMTYNEIAEVLCCPVGTVKSRIHNGLKKLRHLMER
ncbi:MAG: RNA polymerase sigma factor [candidate division WOR-3 bacterium]|nr:MAG: RNA polymerase sigma factor [candidate division WOR-3 bacterium]